MPPATRLVTSLLSSSSHVIIQLAPPLPKTERGHLSRISEWTRPPGEGQEQPCGLGPWLLRFPINTVDQGRGTVRKPPTWREEVGASRPHHSPECTLVLQDRCAMFRCSGCGAPHGSGPQLHPLGAPWCSLLYAWPHEDGLRVVLPLRQHGFGSSPPASEALGTQRRFSSRKQSKDSFFFLGPDTRGTLGSEIISKT